MSKSKKFVPDWYHEKAPERSYRSILKWGDPEAFKAPNSKLYELMKETFHMTDDDFKVKQEMGLEEVDYDIPCRLNDDQIAALEAIVGKANVSTDNYDRLSVAYGKTMVDLMRLRKHIVENVPDAVVYPKNREDIIALVKYCCEQKIPMYVYGGGSSVTRGVEAVKGGITLDMRKNFNKVISFSEHNQTITVEAGMSGRSLKRPSTTPSRPSAQSAPIPAATSRRASSIPPSAAGLSPAAQVRTRAITARSRTSSSARSMSLPSASSKATSSRETRPVLL